MCINHCIVHNIDLYAQAEHPRTAFDCTLTSASKHLETRERHAGERLITMSDDKLMRHGNIKLNDSGLFWRIILQIVTYMHDCFAKTLGVENLVLSNRYHRYQHF